MAFFTVRVEMHAATAEQYELLRERMFAKGFKIFVTGTDGAGGQGAWALPTAEYDYSGEGTAAQVRDIALSIANSVKPGAWVLVTKVLERAWHTAKLKG